MIRRHLRSLARSLVFNDNTLRYSLELARIREALDQVGGIEVLLDAGAGGGYYAAACYLGRCKRLILVEPDPRNFAIARETLGADAARVRFFSCPLEKVPLAAGSVDCVASTQVLEHIPDDGAAVAEFARLLKTGGHALVTTPTPPDIFPNPWHIREGYTEPALIELFAGHGFEHLRTDWFITESSVRIVRLLHRFGPMPRVFPLKEFRESYEERKANSPSHILGLFRKL